jgi:hypothetical protein
MVVTNLHVVGVAVFPNEAYAPLLVDPDAVLTGTSPSKSLEAVSGRNAQIHERLRRIDLRELPQSDSLQFFWQRPAPLPPKELICLAVAEAPNHINILTLPVINVKRQVPVNISSLPS